MHETPMLYISGIVVLGILAQWLSWRLKLPSILALLVIGIIGGPITGILDPDALFGELLFPMVSLGVSLVLFEGALTLKFRDIAGHGSVVTNLVSWGAVLNWILIAAGTQYFMRFSWSIALLFAALVVVTGPTVILPLLRTVRPSQRIGHILKWEGILIDPLGALFAVLVFQFITSGEGGSAWGVLLHEIALGIASGIAGAVFLAFVLKRHWVPEYLQNVLTLAVVISVFTAGNHFGEEAGLLGVTLMGVWLANSPDLDISDILSFKESLSVLIISILFIVLAARVDMGGILEAGWITSGVVATILLVRPIMVWACAIGSDLNWREKTLIAWIAPRGIVAAAISSLFAIRLEQLGYSEAAMLSALTFLVIIFTVVLQSISAGPLARILKVAEEDPRGILIVGANSVARAVGKALREGGFRVLVTDTTWSEIQAARMDGLDTYYGNPVSAHADRHLDLVGIGRLFAMSRRPALNTLACIRYRTEFGKNRVFTLRNAEEKDQAENNRITDSMRAPRLFGEDVTAQKLASLLSQGAEIKTTKITESFSYEDFESLYGKDVIPLFGIDTQDRLRPFTDSYRPPVKEGWLVVSLVPGALIEAADEKKTNISVS
ncbi:cation:proton antiporter [Sedimenticola sp.]|uniref:cation:proton antiporter n=1 Tax=Sedimenticola sp. TaxID=1940285 RepID=UPI003D0C54F9